MCAYGEWVVCVCLVCVSEWCVYVYGVWCVWAVCIRGVNVCVYIWCVCGTLSVCVCGVNVCGVCVCPIVPWHLSFLQSHHFPVASTPHIPSLMLLWICHVLGKRITILERTVYKLEENCHWVGQWGTPARCLGVVARALRWSFRPWLLQAQSLFEFTLVSICSPTPCGCPRRSVACGGRDFAEAEIRIIIAVVELLLPSGPRPVSQGLCLSLFVRCTFYKEKHVPRGYVWTWGFLKILTYFGGKGLGTQSFECQESKYTVYSVLKVAIGCLLGFYFGELESERVRN